MFESEIGHTCLNVAGEFGDCITLYFQQIFVLRYLHLTDIICIFKLKQLKTSLYHFLSEEKKMQGCVKRCGEADGPGALAVRTRGLSWSPRASALSCLWGQPGDRRCLFHGRCPHHLQPGPVPRGS